MFRFASVFLLVTIGKIDSAPPSATAVAQKIDERISARWKATGTRPAPLTDDAAFFRRLNLALAGRIPTAADVRTFLADTDPKKRSRAIDELLRSAACANHLTTVWRGWLLPEAITAPDVAAGTPSFEMWLRNRITADVPVNKWVVELLTYPLDNRAPTAPRTVPNDDSNPLTFYTAKDGKPENLAAATSRLFLGVQLECAQCHDHPFARWSRDQFWGMAAFYGGVTRDGGNLREVSNRREMAIPNTDRTVPATFLDDKQPTWQFRKSPRVTLADWVVAPDNPFFAKATVNRVWGQLFGVGIVDPIDDFHEQNPPSHPELLTDLAEAFVASGYDLKFLLRAIVSSETFQRSSGRTDASQSETRLFARFPIQGLSPEQLFDSLSVVTGTPLEGPGGNYLQANGSPKRQFLDTFNRTGKPTEAQTSILQALTLMNGNLIGSATSGTGRTLTAVVTMPGSTADGRIESLYLICLGRPPRPDELARSRKHIGDDTARHADLLWALVNSIEFRTQH